MSSVYTVKQGETLWDVVLNSTGTLGSATVNNLDLILSANNLADWTPQLFAGQQITIPDTVIMDLNALRQLQLYPAVNNLSTGIQNQIIGIFDQLNSLWILTTTYWNDLATWIDTQFWTD